MNPYPYDPAEAIAHLKHVEPVFAPVLDEIGPFQMEYQPLENVFRYLLRSIVYQQLSGKAAGTILGRVHALFEKPPTAQAIGDISDESLRAAGMSFGKIRAARSLAEHVLGGHCPSVDDLQQMSNDEIRESLTVVRGIGVWTVNMLLIFRLGRPDVMPSADLGIRKGYARLMGMDELPKPKALMEATLAWSPWRSVGSWYLWRTLEIELPD